MLKLYKVLGFTMILLLPVLISSCVSIQKHPSEWPPLIAVEDEICPNISGSYVNEGEKTDGTRINFLDISGATHLQINQLHDHTVEILFLDNDQLAGKNIYSKKKGEYSCTSDGIRISLGSHVTTDFGEGLMPLFVSQAAAYLRRNASGDLIMKGASSGMGLYLFIPVAGYATDYVRFKQKQE